jgi:Domain of unknown function (DUF6602)/Resolvase, N terminal domain
VDTLERKGVALRILNLGGETVDTRGATGRLILNVFAAFAQFEREMMLERQREGIAKAKAEGKYKGRKPTARAKAKDAVELFHKAVPEYTEWLASSISRYEALAKSIVAHRGEKGRIVEGVVKSALRAILPGRFSIGTGFAITSSGKTSPQLDLVIYDALLNAPIILEGGIGLFPIECIYGFVAVKSVWRTFAS